MPDWSREGENLGKGSVIAALQNLNLLLGCDEFAGLYKQF